jgi:hypothetical protein
MVSSGMLCRAALVKTDVSEERSASFIRVTRIGEGGATFLRNVGSYESHTRYNPEDAIFKRLKHLTACIEIVCQ